MPAALKGACISGHILNHYVAVDVGKEDVVGSHLQQRCIPAGGLNARPNLVPPAVAPGAACGNKVNVHGKHLAGAHLGGKNPQNCRAAAHVAHIGPAYGKPQKP